ncbi:MAG: thermonuclease family protein [Chitinophagales bacterium]|jgi:endonuclease YncB( thermonuclease family)|nr:thermonuclease family protein [Chitinophagales bacterium]
MSQSLSNEFDYEEFIAIDSLARLDSFETKITYVVDGDTYAFRVGDSVLKIREAYIDCPEKWEPLATEATNFAKSKIDKKRVWVFPIGVVDKYGRLVAEVYYAKDSSLSEALLDAGLAVEF